MKSKNPDDGRAMRASAWILLAFIRISKREVQKPQVSAGVWGKSLKPFSPKNLTIAVGCVIIIKL